MCFCERTDDGDTYNPSQMLADIRWGELKQEPVRADLYRRNLQRAHVEHLASLVEERTASFDVSSLAGAELQIILEIIGGVVGRVEAQVPAAHLADLRTRIQVVLDPRGRGDSD